MLVYINKQKVGVDLRDAQNLEDVLSLLSRDHLPPGSPPSQVKVNGRPYQESHPHAARELPIESIYLLEIDSMNPQEVAREVLEKGSLQLEKICAAFQTSADLLRTADAVEANQYFLSSLDSLHWFLRLIQEVQTVLHLDFQKIKHGPGSVEERINRLLGVLDVITKVQEDKDYVILADLVEYELVPLLGEWKGIIQVLKSS